MSLQTVSLTTPRGVVAARALGAADAPLALCVHGFPDDASTFDALLARLAAEGFYAVARTAVATRPRP